jgi:hypothetical protein
MSKRLFISSFFVKESKSENNERNSCENDKILMKRELQRILAELILSHLFWRRMR